MKLQRIIERHWYYKIDPLLMIILFPFSLIYEIIIRWRRLLFRLHLVPTHQLKVPVVIIGNISVGGAGKTPLTKYLAQSLTTQGYQVGIILRGYKSASKQAHIVQASDSSTSVGDEALIYAQNGFKVAIGSRRVAAGKLLLQHYPDIQLILADDGMQHYALARDMEICVVDSTRLFGNQQLLPLGPLREPLSRLHKVDAIVVNGSANQAQLQQIVNHYLAPLYLQKLDFQDFYNPISGLSANVAYFSGQQVMAIAAIANPGRFFSYLENLGLKLTAWQAYPDHYHYQATDINPEYAIITTEKDYTKLAKFNAANIWIARVNAHCANPALLENIKRLIK